MIRTIAEIIAAVLTAVETWKPTSNVGNDLSDLIIVLNTAGSVGVQTPPLLQSVLKLATETTAGAADLESGQVSLLATIGVSYPGYGPDKIIIPAVRQYISGGEPAGSPAAAIKTMLGL